MARLEIIIRQEGGGGGGITPGNNIPINPQMPPSQVPNPYKEEKNDSRALKYGLGVATMVAQQTISYATSNIGKWTGNSKNQERVNIVNTMLGIATAFAVNPVLGVASVAIQGATAFADYKFERAQEEQRVQYQRNISGLAYGESIFTKRRH